MNLLKSEWRKLVYARANWGLLVAAVAISVLSVTIMPFVLDNQGEQLGLSLDSQAGVDSVYANGISGYIFSIVIGVMVVTGEFRHGTAVATFLTSPKRYRVVMQKMAIGIFAGILVMLISTLISFAAGWAVLQNFDGVAAPSDDLLSKTLLAAAVGGGVLGLIGVAIGTLVRNQMIAITSTLIYLFIIDPLLLTLWPDAGKWLPSGLITGMMALDFEAESLGINTADYLPPVVSAFVLIGIGLIFAGAALVTSLKRDVE